MQILRLGGITRTILTPTSGGRLKYQNWSSFEKHLSEAAPDHLSLVYLMAIACSFERKKLFAQILAAIQKKDPGATPFLCDAASLSTTDLIDQLNSPSLFGGLSVVFFDGIEKLKKGEWKSCPAMSRSPPPLLT